MMKEIYFYTAILVSFGMLISCGQKTSVDQPAADRSTLSVLITIPRDQFEASELRMESISQASFPVEISASGRIDVPPNSRATINAFMGGYVKDFPLLIGDKVRKGQKLVTLENLEFLELQQQYLETSQKLKYLEAEFKRQSELYEENINSKKVFMKAESDYEKIKILHHGLQKKLRLIQIDPDGITTENMRSTASIYAPISGSVTEVHVNAGTHVNPDNPIMEIVNSDHLHLEIQVFEKDALRIYKGQEVRFRVPEYSEQTFSAEVHVIGKSVAKDRTVMVHAHLDPEHKERFIPGMFVQAEILAEESMRPALPVEALANLEGKNHLLELSSENDEELTFRKIELPDARERNGFVELDAVSSDQNRKYLVGYTAFSSQ